MQQKIYSLLFEISPKFVEHWNSVAPISRDVSSVEELDDLLWAFARHLLEMHQDSEITSFPSIIKALDNYYLSGEPYANKHVVKLLGFIGYDWWDSGVDPNDFFILVPPHLQSFCVIAKPIA